MKRLKAILKDAIKQIWQDVKTYGWAILVAIACLFVLWILFHRICIFAIVTGLPCPGCGLTRATLALFRLDFKLAFSYHPFVYPITILGIVAIINRYFRRNPQPRWIFFAIIFLCISMLIYYIFRFATGTAIKI